VPTPRFFMSASAPVWRGRGAIRRASAEKGELSFQRGAFAVMLTGHHALLEEDDVGGVAEGCAA